MLNGSTIYLSINKVAKLVKDNLISFDNINQRSEVWETSRKSLFIHSMIEGYPTTMLFFIELENGVYSCMDGQQRCLTVTQFLNDNFALVDIPDIKFHGEELNINGKRFSELHEDIQDAIKDTMLTAMCFKNITDNEIADLFFRLNNGKPLSNIELSRVRIKNLDTLRELANHEALKIFLSKSSFKKYHNEELIIKLHIALYGDNKDMTSKSINEYTNDLEIMDDQKIDIELILNYCEEIYNHASDEEKKQLKKCMKYKNLLYVLILAYKWENDNVNYEDAKNFILSHFENLDFNDTGKNPTHDVILSRINIVLNLWNERLNDLC